MGPKWRAWVKRYKVSYSNNSAAWHFYSDNGHTVKVGWLVEWLVGSVEKLVEK